MKNVAVRFGVSPYESAINKGYQDCFVISTMQIGDGDVLFLASPNPNQPEGPGTSAISTWLPEDTAGNVFNFLRFHDLFDQHYGSKDLRHANCHAAAEVGPGWIRPDEIDPNLLYRHRLAADEVERVALMRLGT